MTALMLTPEEVARLTGRKRVQAQARALQRMGLSYRLNDAGEVIIARALAERHLGVFPLIGKREPDLNWQAMARAGIIPARGETAKG